jgi:hypothetical protein
MEVSLPHQSLRVILKNVVASMKRQLHILPMNLTPYSMCGMTTPYELCTVSLNLKHLHVFGCHAYLLESNYIKTSLKPRGLLLSFWDTRKHLSMCLKTRTKYNSVNVVYKENEFPYQKALPQPAVFNDSTSEGEASSIEADEEVKFRFQEPVKKIY